MNALARVVRVGHDLVSYSVRQGEWWLLLVVAVLAAVVAVVATGHTVVPYTIYTFF